MNYKTYTVAVALMPQISLACLANSNLDLLFSNLDHGPFVDG